MHKHAFPLMTTAGAIAVAVGLAGCGGGGASVEGDKPDNIRVLEGGKSLSIEATGKSEIDKIEMMTWQVQQTDGPPDTEERITFTNANCEDHTSTQDDKYVDIWKCSIGIEASATVQSTREYTLTAVVLNQFDTEAELSYRLRVEPASSTDLVVDAGEDKVAKPGDEVSLSCDYANGAFDDGQRDEQATIEWSIVDNADFTMLSLDAEGAEASFEAPAPRTTTDLMFQCAVTDGAGNTATDRTVVSVIGATELAPLEADAGAVQVVAMDETVFLDASGTTDPTDSGLSIYYQWEQVDGPEVELVAADAEKAMFTPPMGLTEPTDFVFRLYVSRVPIDAGSEFADSEIDQTTVRVEQQSVSIDVTVSGPTEVDEGTNVRLDASGSTAEEGQNLYFFWEQTAGPTVYFDDPTAATTAFTAPDVNPETDVVARVYASTQPLNSSNKDAAEYTSHRVTIRDTNGF